jgi:hypothetical protein
MKVLVLNQHSEVADSLANSLRARFGFQALPAYSPEEAQENASKINFDVTIVDWDNPQRGSPVPDAAVGAWDALFLGLRLQVLMPDCKVVLYKEQIPKEYHDERGLPATWFLECLRSEGFRFHWLSKTDTDQVVLEMLGTCEPKSASSIRDETSTNSSLGQSELQNLIDLARNRPTLSWGAVNRKQRVCLTVGFLLLVLATLFPPWKVSGGRYASSSSYGFLFSPPYSGATIDVPRLQVEWALVALATAGLFLLRTPRGIKVGTSSENLLSRRKWNRLMVLSGFLILGTAVAASLVLWAGYAHRHRSTPPITWSPLRIEAAGLIVFLKTEVMDGEVLYQFRVSPSSPDLAHTLHFNIAANSVPYARQFTVVLYDEGGFQVCSENFETTPEVDAKGAFAALLSNGKMTSCSIDRYFRARNWNLLYNFPPVSIVQEELNKQH